MQTPSEVKLSNYSKIRNALMYSVTNFINGGSVLNELSDIIKTIPKYDIKMKIQNRNIILTEHYIIIVPSTNKQLMPRVHSLYQTIEFVRSELKDNLAIIEILDENRKRI